MNGTNYQTNYGEGYSQMSLTEKLRAESNAEKKTDGEKAIPAKNETPHNPAYPDRNTSEKGNGEKTDTLKNDSAAPSEDVKNAEPKKPKGRKNKRELTPAEEEKFIMKRMAKNDAENAAYGARLVIVRKAKSEEDLQCIYKICTDKDIALSDLIAFLKHLKNSDTLKMLISEISVRSKTVKKNTADKSEVNSV